MEMAEGRANASPTPSPSTLADAMNRKSSLNPEQPRTLMARSHRDPHAP